MTKEEYLKTHEINHEGIKNIELTFENCDIATIPRNMIKVMSVENIDRYFYGDNQNGFESSKYARNIILCIENANQKYIPFEGQVLPKLEPVPLIERIRYNDITQIDVNYLWDDEHHSWSVDYEEENIVVLGSPNVLQRTEEYNGDIWIAIGKEAIKNLDAYILTRRHV